jgi:hypothetical protein
MVLLEDMIEAYFDCRRKKRNTASALAYEMNYEFNLLDLTRRINERSYTPGKSICFVVRRPRYREVFAAAFEDRIIHHYIGLRLTPLFEMVLGDRTFNCREGKGQLYGIHTLKEDIKACSENYTKDCYVMKLDLKAFFMSIDKRLLAKLIDDFVVRYYKGDDIEDVRFMCKTVIMHDPEKNCEKHSPDEYWKYLPKDKSLFTNGEGKGIAIGNLFSQQFANYLLSLLEPIFAECGVPLHGRYVDDLYAVHADKAVLLALVPAIRAKLSELGLRLNEKKFYLQHYSKGITFTGTVVKPGRSYVVRHTIENFKHSVAVLSSCKDAKDVRKAVTSVNSYLGLLRQNNTYELRKRILSTIDKSVFEYIYIKGHYDSVAIKNRYTLRFETFERIKQEDEKYRKMRHAA